LRPGAAAITGLTAVLLLAGYLVKRPCEGPPWDGREFRTACYNDLQYLFPIRGIREHLFPYVEGALVDGQLVGGAIEYPVLTGIFAWLAGLPVSDMTGYLRVSALLLAPFGLLTAWMLARLAGPRALLWALAPGLALYAFHNWDLLVVAAMVGAVAAWAAGRPGLAAALLAVGAALKVYPGFFVLPLALERLAAGDRRGAVRVIASAAGTWLALNLPFAAVNPSGWWATYAFQALREADLTTNSIWFWGLPHLERAQLNLLVPVLVAVAWLVALGVGGLRARREGSYPWLQVSAAMLLAFLLLNKVHSPQFLLWLLPFFVLLRLPIGWWAAYAAVDLALYVGVFRWYWDLSQGRDFGLAKQALIVGVWGRAALLVLLYVVVLRAGLAMRTPASGARSSTPPAGSSAADFDPGGKRTGSSPGRSTSRTTRTA